MHLKQRARVAGFYYLIVVLTGIFSLAYVPSKLFVWKDAALTYNNIISSEFLFRAGIAASVLCYIAFILLPLALYRVFKEVNNRASILMVVFALISVPISLSNLQNKLAILSLIKNAKDYSAQELYRTTMMYLHQYNDGLLIVSFFWGLWLFPLGYLIYKSSYLPKLLGVLLMLGCMAYVINCFGFTLYPSYGKIGISAALGKIPSLAEISTCLWLLIMGAKEKSITKTK